MEATVLRLLLCLLLAASLLQVQVGQAQPAVVYALAGDPLSLEGFYVGGHTGDVGQLTRWTGTAWEHVVTAPKPIQALVTVGTDVFVGAGAVYRLDGQQLVPLGSLTGTVWALALYEGELYVGGSFVIEGSSTAQLGRWRDNRWEAISGLETGAAGLRGPEVRELTPHATGLFVGGGFADAGGKPDADLVARWSGSQWHAVGTSLTTLWPYGLHVVKSIAVSEDGGSVYVGTGDGGYTTQAFDSILLRWNSREWEPLPVDPIYSVDCDGGYCGYLRGAVQDLAFFQGDLYVGGFFSLGDGASTYSFAARWDGTNMQSFGPTGGRVRFLPDGLGVQAWAVRNGELLGGGGFAFDADVNAAERVFEWDGTTTRGFVIQKTLDGPVYSLDFRNGVLYVGGAFNNAFAIPEADGLVVQENGVWHALGDTSGVVVQVEAADTAVYVIRDDGSSRYEEPRRPRSLWEFSQGEWRMQDYSWQIVRAWEAYAGLDCQYVKEATSDFCWDLVVASPEGWETKGLNISGIPTIIGGYEYCLLYRPYAHGLTPDLICALDVEGQFSLRLETWEHNPDTPSAIQGGVVDGDEVYVWGNSTQGPWVMRWDGGEWSHIEADLQASIAGFHAQDGVLVVWSERNTNAPEPCYGISCLETSLYTFANGTWTSFGTVTGRVYDVAFDLENQGVYAGGEFTSDATAAVDGSPNLALFTLPTGTRTEETAALESSVFRGLYIAPTPYEVSTTLTLDLTDPISVRIEVFDVLGRHVSTVFAGVVGAGTRAFRMGDTLPGGLYFARVSAGSEKHVIAFQSLE